MLLRVNHQKKVHFYATKNLFTQNLLINFFFFFKIQILAHYDIILILITQIYFAIMLVLCYIIC